MVSSIAMYHKQFNMLLNKETKPNLGVMTLKMYSKFPKAPVLLEPHHQIIYFLGCPRGVMVKAMNCGIVVREFVLQSRYYVRANTLGKGMNPPYSPSSYG